MNRLKNGHIEFAISETFTTIVCEECGQEFILFVVLRTSDKDQYGPDNIMPQAHFDHCPWCGHHTPMKNSYKETDLGKEHKTS